MPNKVFENPTQSGSATASLMVKVVVLDDDESFRALARAILEPGGFEVLESASVPQCLRQMREQAVVAVVLDMVMPEQDGFEAIREFKDRFPKIRIVAVSGASESELYLTESAYLGADASLEKSRIGVLCPLLRVVLDR
ncbi:MAG TPA: response regulator [Bryobacteraceae bacterium]|nr:response regulator [Bryobacteraceae bacterium]